MIFKQTMKLTPPAWLASLLSGKKSHPTQKQVEENSKVKLDKSDILVVPEGYPETTPEMQLAKQVGSPVIEVVGLVNLAVIKSW
jgi:hypothetical protein